MIQAIRETNFNAFIETEANRIDTTVAVGQIRHLVKFSNDLDEAVFYAYPAIENIYDRFTQMNFIYNATPDRYTGRIKLIPAGYYKYLLCTRCRRLPELQLNRIFQGSS